MCQKTAKAAGNSESERETISTNTTSEAVRLGCRLLLSHIMAIKSWATKILYLDLKMG